MAKPHEQMPRVACWKRIDRQGMDICLIDRSEGGYAIKGSALYLAEGEPAKLDYHVACDAHWCSQWAQVSGWMGATEKTFTVARSSRGFWTVAGERIVGVDGLLDVDLGFTPATNTNAIKRLGLEIGALVETTAVWLDVEDWSFKPLRQAYRRCSETVYDYSSPSHDYRADLVVDDFGLVRVYPQLWEAIP